MDIKQLAITGYNAHLKVLKEVFPESVAVPWENLPRGVQRSFVTLTVAILDSLAEQQIIPAVIGIIDD